jgi:hypothetical protein
MACDQKLGLHASVSTLTPFSRHTGAHASSWLTLASPAECPITLSSLSAFGVTKILAPDPGRFHLNVQTATLVISGKYITCSVRLSEHGEAHSHYSISSVEISGSSFPNERYLRRNREDFGSCGAESPR